MKIKSIGLFLLTLLAVGCQKRAAQAQVVLITPPRFSSIQQDGTPNAFGCVWSYVNNTTTPQATYTDSTGVTLNPNPVPLDASGAANIWLSSGQIYTIVIKTSGGVNCASGSTVSTTNGVNQGILNLANTWNGTQTFLSPIFLNPSDLQIVFGSPSGTQTTLDIPPTSSNLILHGPPITVNDTLVSQSATQTISGKTFTLPFFNGGTCPIVNGPASYICIANANPTGTALNSLVKLINAPSQATVPGVLDTIGVIGICVANCGNTGTATIQQSGIASCTFSNATTAGDYVIISTTSGDCLDTGAAIQGTTETIGRVLTTNATPGTYSILLTLQTAAIAVGNVNLGSAVIGIGACTTLTVSATGAITGSTVAWAYNTTGGGPNSSDLKLIVSPETTTNQIIWNICNPGTGAITQSGNANVSWRLLP